MLNPENRLGVLGCDRSYFLGRCLIDFGKFGYDVDYVAAFVAFSPVWDWGEVWRIGFKDDVTKLYLMQKLVDFAVLERYNAANPDFHFI